MQPEFADMLEVLDSSKSLAQFCLNCPIHGFLLDEQTVLSFTKCFLTDVVENEFAPTCLGADYSRLNSVLSFQQAQNFCMFIREGNMLDAAVSTKCIQHIINSFFRKYITGYDKIAMEQECATQRDAILALYFKSFDIRRPGVLKGIKDLNGKNLLRLIVEYTKMDEYIQLMFQYVDGNIEKMTADTDEAETSFKTFRQTFGHIVRCLISCGVNPYDVANDNQSFVDVVSKRNFYALIKDNYDGYIEETEEKAKEQAV